MLRHFACRQERLQGRRGHDLLGRARRGEQREKQDSGQKRQLTVHKCCIRSGSRLFDRVRHDINDGREILWLSERDGWSHLYLYDGVTGRVKNQITRGPWVVRAVDHVDHVDAAAGPAQR